MNQARTSFVCLLCLLGSSCVSTINNTIPIISSTLPSPTQPSAPTSGLQALWVSDAVPDALGAAALGWKGSLSDTKEGASLWLDAEQSSANGNPTAVWVYALAAPFPTVVDDVTLGELQAAWRGSAPGVAAIPSLVMSKSTLEAFKAIWGQPVAAKVKSLPSDQLLAQAWNENPSWAILPFEELEPRWKVIAVDGQSPVRKDFDRSSYPLTVEFSLQSNLPLSDLSVQPAALNLPATNRDPEKLTIIILSGVTALVRATAFRMEQKGITYPGRDIREILRAADIAHISNEVPFDSSCSYPDPAQAELVFCSSPRYFELLTDVGADVVELTGNHFGDHGESAMLETLEIYRQAGLPYYGGGADLKDARKPLVLEHNGNRIAFIGCNRPDIGTRQTATEATPGAAPCDFDFMTRQVNELASQGYLVITTFQWFERGEFDPLPLPSQENEFRLMADSGAAIVSGSQAHFPLTMEFYGSSFIHYGLGNLFFDSRASYERKEFLDRYVVYNGRLVSIELLTMVLEDYSRPRPMTPEERTTFLREYFDLSGWPLSGETVK